MHLKLSILASLSCYRAQVGSFDAEVDWSHVLSSGEQQRVAMLRLVLHAPRLAFLDEVRGLRGRQYTLACGGPYTGRSMRQYAWARA